ncbi:MAG: hypothetical protein V4634_13675 [Pseudomonadota bacterium]
MQIAWVAGVSFVAVDGEPAFGGLFCFLTPVNPLTLFALMLLCGKITNYFHVEIICESPEQAAMQQTDLFAFIKIIRSSSRNQWF